MQSENKVSLIANDIVVEGKQENNTTDKPKKSLSQFFIFMALILFFMSFILTIIAVILGDLTDIKIIYDPPSNLPQNYVDCNNHYIGTTTSKHPINYYIFDITPNNNNGSVTFNTCNSSYDVQLHFYNSNWTLIKQCQRCTHCSAPIYLGEYYIKISNNISEYGKYKFQINCSHQYMTPAPTIYVPNTPPKALLTCGYNGIKDILYGNDYFFCGDYDEFCDEWSILCSMKSSVQIWIILGIFAIIIGILTLIMISYGCKKEWANKNSKLKYSKISGTLLMIIYLIVCIVNVVIYNSSSTCYDDYCSKVSTIWDAEYYKCDFESDGISLFFMWFAMIMGIPSVCLYGLGRKVGIACEKWSAKYNNRIGEKEEKNLNSKYSQQ
eukprot:282313_1